MTDQEKEHLLQVEIALNQRSILRALMCGIRAEDGSPYCHPVRMSKQPLVIINSATNTPVRNPPTDGSNWLWEEIPRITLQAAYDPARVEDIADALTVAENRLWSVAAHRAVAIQPKMQLGMVIGAHVVSTDNPDQYCKDNNLNRVDLGCQMAELKWKAHGLGHRAVFNHASTFEGFLRAEWPQDIVATVTDVLNHGSYSATKPEFYEDEHGRFIRYELGAAMVVGTVSMHSRTHKPYGFGGNENKLTRT